MLINIIRAKKAKVIIQSSPLPSLIPVSIKIKFMIDNKIMPVNNPMIVNMRPGILPFPINPIKLVINNVPDDYEEECELPNNPSDENTTNYKTTFTKEVYIEEDDFMLNPPPKYYRLTPGGVVRLKGAYIVRYTGCDQDANGKVTTVYADIVENSRSGQDTSGVKCKGVIHWVSCKYAKKATFNLYESLLVDNGMEDFNDRLNKDSKQSIEGFIEPELLNAKNEEKFQFIRVGYFVKDRYCKENENIFNRIVALKDSFKM